jgi:hypothetical protein
MLVGLLLIFFFPLLSGRAHMWEDFLEQNYPYRLFAARSLADGVFPFWNPYIFGGMPFFADVQTGVLFPTNLLLTFFVSGRWLASQVVQIAMVLHLLIAGIGMYLFGRAVRFRPWTALFIAATYMLNGRFVVHLTHTQQVQTFVLTPLILLLALRAVEDPGLRRFAWALLGGVAIGIAALAGYPQAVAIILSAALVIVVYSGLAQPRRIPDMLLVVGLAAAVAIGVAACQYLPSQRLFAFTTRGEYTYAEIVEGSFHPLRFASLLVPDFFGTTAGGQYGSYAGPGPYYQYWEQMAYVGILPLLLALIGAARGRRQAILPLALVGVSLAIALGRHIPVHILLYKYVPLFDDMRTPAKFLQVTIFGLSWLAGIGLEQLLDHRLRQRWPLLLGIGALTAILILLAAAPSDQRVHAVAISSSIRAAALAAISTALLLFTCRTRRWFAPALVTAVSFVDLFLFGYRYNNGRIDPADYWGQNRLVQFLKTETASKLVRASIRRTEGLILPRNTGYVQEFATTDGYNPLSLRRFQRAMRSLERERFLSLSGVAWQPVVDSGSGRLTLAARYDYLPRAKLFASWEVIPDTEAMLARLGDPAYDYRSTALVERPVSAEPQTSEDPGSAAIVTNSPNRIEVRVNARAPALLVLTENYYPGWRAAVDGSPVEVIPINHFLRGSLIPAGEHSVVFRYVENGFASLLLVSLGTLLLASASAIYVLAKTRVN